MFERDLAELDRGRAEVAQAAHGVERRGARRASRTWRTRGRDAPAAPPRPAPSAWAAPSAPRSPRAAKSAPPKPYNLFWSSLIFLGLGLLALKCPKAIAMPLGVLAVWFAVAGLFQAWRLYRA